MGEMADWILDTHDPGGLSLGGIRGEMAEIEVMNGLLYDDSEPVRTNNGRKAMATATLPQARKAPMSIASVMKKGTALPNRYGLYAREKWGKTSLAAQFPGAVFVQSRGETGLDPLIDAGLVPETPHFPEAATWEEFMQCLKALRDEDHPYKVAVLDTLNGAERLCHEETCTVDFGGDWGERGFASYQKGPEVALRRWREMLGILDQLRIQRRMTVMCLIHTKVAKYQNPAGPDYDQFFPDLDKRTWALTAKWLDVILFGNFWDDVTNVKENKKTGEAKGKGKGGTERVLYTQGCAAFVAGNRLGLSPGIPMGSSPAEGFANFSADLREARQRNKATTAPAEPAHETQTTGAQG